METKKILFSFLGVAALILSSCEDDKNDVKTKTVENKPAKQVNVPDFNADSAYAYTAAQVAFGPRVPGTDAHVACGNWLEAKLKSFGAEVISQTGTVTAYNGKELPMRNIIGSYHPDKKDRLLLFAHWDTRPFADKDEDRQSQPIDGANDGASGVGVLLELARLFQSQSPDMGIDIIFFDTEDYGAPEGGIEAGEYTDWCLGSQFWSKNPHVPGYSARYGILLDMVGGKDAVFPREGTSMYFAPRIVKKVWDTAKEMGYGNYFIDNVSGETIDDHLFVNQLAKIPSIDIVHFHTEGEHLGYGHFHHTHDDTMEGIDKNTLEAVGKVVAKVVYME